MEKHVFKIYRCFLWQSQKTSHEQTCGKFLPFSDIVLYIFILKSSPRAFSRLLSHSYVLCRTVLQIPLTNLNYLQAKVGGTEIPNHSID